MGAASKVFLNEDVALAIGRLITADKADNVILPMGLTGRPLLVRVDVVVAYHCYCADAATVAAWQALRASEAVDTFAMLDVLGVSWCSENDHLQIQGAMSYSDLVKNVLTLGAAAHAIQAAAYVLTDWKPA